jgi:hypothetical protein
MTWDTATTVGLDRLYHYQPHDFKRLSQIVLGKELYFSKPNDFNDPWDCRPWWNTDNLDDPNAFNRHINWYIKITRKQMPNLPDTEIQKRANSFRSDPNTFKEKMIEISLSIEETINQRYRVYCLSSKADSELMWAHYSNKHQGICLEFNVRSDLFCSALRLSYQDIYPNFDLTDEKSEDQIRPLTAKSSAWSYEDEYRLIAQEERFRIAEDTIMASNNIVQLPDSTLKSITVGCLSTDTTINEVKSLISDAPYPIELRQAIRERNKYRLSIISI